MRFGVKIDSKGSCLHNSNFENHSGGKVEQKQKEIAHYKFYFAFENSNVEDYVTEKVFLQE